jgi:glycosyltransferase involved in cell wall biosynthesis
MKKLALVVPSLTKGGGVPAVARFVKDAALSSGSYQLQLISLCMASNGSASRLLHRPSTWLRGPATIQGTWEGLPFTHVGADWSELEFQRYRPRSPLKRVLADCDLIQMVCGSPAWANAVLGQGKPVALQVATRSKVERRRRDANLKRARDWWRKLMTEITDRMDDRALRQVDAIQVENPWMFEYARKLNNGRKVDLRYAPPGINTDVFRPLPNRDVTSSSYILCVGRLGDARKNVGLLLAAYASLPDGLRQRARLVLAGSSPPPDSFWTWAKALQVSDRVSYVARPSQEELVRLYQEASVFVLPSDEEGLGVVVLEAMACAAPVVSTRSGGPDGILTDGEDGFLVPLDDPATMAARLQILLENPSLNILMGKKGRATVKARYDEQLAGAVFVDMWDRLTG